MRDFLRKFRKGWRSFWNKGQYVLTLVFTVALFFGAVYALEKLPMFEEVRYAIAVYTDQSVAAYAVYSGDELLGTVEDYSCIADAWDAAVVRLNSGVISYKVDIQYTVTPTTVVPSKLQSAEQLQNNIKFYLFEKLKSYTNTAISVSFGSTHVILKDRETVYEFFAELAQNMLGDEHTVRCIGFEDGQPVYVLDNAAGTYQYDGILPMAEDAGSTLVGVYINADITIQTLYVMNEDIQELADAVADCTQVDVCKVYRTVYQKDEEVTPVYVDNAGMYQGQTSLISAGTPSVLLKDDLVYVSVAGGTEQEVKRTQQSSQMMEEGTAAQYYSGTKVPVSFIWPTIGVITSYYGWRSEFGSFHSGLDIANRKYTPIYAAADGVVTLASRTTNLGNTVVINHGNGYVTWYAHCAGGTKQDDYLTTQDLWDEANGFALLVSVGDYVYQGQIIAYMGSTGYSTGPHLHFEIEYNGKNVDPLNYLP